MYFLHRYPFMNNNGCQIYFILLPNLLVGIEIINIQKLVHVTHVTHCLSGIYYKYVCYTAALGSFKALGQPGARPFSPNTGIWLRALRITDNSYNLHKKLKRGENKQNSFKSSYTSTKRHQRHYSACIYLMPSTTCSCVVL